MAAADAADSRWLSEYTARANELFERGSRVGATVAARWGERSLRDDDWTVDTVTADLIEAWEELTPVVGEGIELWLELVQRALRTDHA
jgi:hypothetical protein